MNLNIFADRSLRYSFQGLGNLYQACYVLFIIRMGKKSSILNYINSMLLTKIYCTFKMLNSIYLINKHRKKI